MATKAFIIFIVSSLLLSGCRQGIAPVDILMVDSIRIMPNSVGDTITEAPFRLNDFSKKAFIEDLNKAHSIGPCKYFPQYNIIVFMKNGTQRDFRANGENIKENTDECFDIGEANYFRNLYSNNKNNSH